MTEQPEIPREASEWHFQHDGRNCCRFARVLALFLGPFRPICATFAARALFPGALIPAPPAIDDARHHDQPGQGAWMIIDEAFNNLQMLGDVLK